MILVTGGAGLLGKAVIDKLISEGKKVRATYNRTPLQSHPLVEQVHTDILDLISLEEAMEGVTQLYHCAGFVSFDPGDRRQLMKINVEGTANVVNTAVAAGIQKMIHVSSVAALGRIREGKPITEQEKWSPETSNSVYGESKYKGELEVWRGIAEGLNAAIVNPVIIFGPGEWNDGSTQIFKSVYDGMPWYTTGSSGFVDVRDVADAMYLLMESDISEQRYIISGHNVEYREVLNQIADAFGKKRPSKAVTPFLANMVWRLEKMKSWFTHKRPLITKESAATAMTKATFDNSKFLNAFPQFKYRTLAETIDYSVKGLQQKLNNR